MKNRILLSLLGVSSILMAMNDNNTHPIRFESAEILYHRLYSHDRKHGTDYVPLAEKNKLHDSLGSTIRLRSEASTIIKRCLKRYNPDMTEAQMLEHKRNIINILHPELVGPKL